MIGKNTVEGMKLDVLALVNLPLLQRLFHKKSRKTLIACTIGMIIMLCGSLIAQSGHAIGHYLGISYILWIVEGILCMEPVLYRFSGTLKCFGPSF